MSTGYQVSVACVEYTYNETKFDLALGFMKLKKERETLKNYRSITLHMHE